MDFVSFPKIGRLNSNCTITEKIDGTNAQIVINEDGSVLAGSRNRWITPEDDNFGFARWVSNNSEELKKLGVGRFYGEWYGAGIQRTYGLKEKKFVLFPTRKFEQVPSICQVVPVLYEGVFHTEIIDAVMETLKKEGSQLVKGFDNPEGIIVYHHKSDTVFKYTFEHKEGKFKA